MKSYRILTLLILSATLMMVSFACGAGKGTIQTTIQPPPGYTRLPVQPNTFAASLRDLALVDQPQLLAGDGKTLICDDEKVAVTAITPYDNEHDVGVDGVVKLWGEYLWNRKAAKVISFPLDNGQVALWKDWRDGLRPKKKGGQFIFTQVTTPDGGYQNYTRYLSFVAEEMGAVALRRESSIIVDDSLTVGDLIVAAREEKESRIGLIVDACRNVKGEKLYLIGTSGTPSTTFYIMRPYSPVQGLNEWFTLDGAKYAIGLGSKTDTRRVTLK
jgi:hypothetical protein